MKSTDAATTSIKKAPFVSIVFPNYNGGEFVNKCVNSTLALNYPDDCFEIIIIDNGSTDGSLERLKEEYTVELEQKKIVIIEIGENVGAPAAYNRGITAANPSYDFILKMDNDLVLDKNCLDRMVRCANKDPLNGVVGGKVYFYWEKNRIHAIGSIISIFFAGGKAVGGSAIDRGQYNTDRQFDAINGCMMLVKKEVIDRVGLMDEKYFIYFDDHDWSLRISARGYKHIFCHDAISWHNTKPYNRYNSKLWMNYAVYNSYYFAVKNYGFIKRMIFFIAIQINVIRYTAGYLRKNRFNNFSEFISLLIRANGQGMKLLFLGKGRGRQWIKRL